MSKPTIRADSQRGSSGASDRPHRVLVFTPFRNDAAVVCKALDNAGFDTCVCPDISSLCSELQAGAAVALLSVEVLSEDVRRQIADVINCQPVWSRFPFVVLTRASHRQSDHWLDLLTLGSAAQLTLLDQPVRVVTLISAVRAAVRFREAQYRVQEELQARKRVELELRASQAALRRVNESLEQQVAQRTSALRLTYDVALMSNTADDVEAAIVFVLRRVCEHNCWVCGHAWLRDKDDRDRLFPRFDWYGRELERCASFCAGITSMGRRRGQSLVGRVWASGRPEFIDQLGDDLPPEQAQLAMALGIRNTCAFPVTSGGECVAVLQFFGREPTHVTNEVTAYMTTIGTQLGRVIERERAAEALNRSKERLDMALAASDLAFWDCDLETAQLTVDPRWAAMLGYETEEIEPSTNAWDSLIHPDDVARVQQARFRHLAGRVASFEVEYRLRMKSGSWKWTHTRGRVAARADDGRPLRLIGTHRDISEKKELERGIVEAAVEEQRRIGRELHDGVGGDLTGLGFVVQGLIDDLEGSSHVSVAEGIGRELDRVIEQVRLLSHGLNPVGVDKDGLAVALEKLAQRTRRLYGVSCEVQTMDTVHIDDNLVTDHLYRIAQEAVTNAVKHAGAGNIRITLSGSPGKITLRVSDDGGGMREDQPAGEGTGLRNMHYRAGLIGASLHIQSGERGGTVVHCDYASDRM